MEVSGEAGLCGRKGKAQFVISQPLADITRLGRQFRNFDSEAVLQFDLDIGAQLDIIKAELGVFTLCRFACLNFRCTSVSKSLRL